MRVQGPSTCQGACLKLFGRPCYLCWDNAQETESLSIAAHSFAMDLGNAQ